MLSKTLGIQARLEQNMSAYPCLKPKFPFYFSGKPSKIWPHDHWIRWMPDAVTAFIPFIWPYITEHCESSSVVKSWSKYAKGTGTFHVIVSSLWGVTNVLFFLQSPLWWVTSWHSGDIFLRRRLGRGDVCMCSHKCSHFREQNVGCGLPPHWPQSRVPLYSPMAMVNRMS